MQQENLKFYGPTEMKNEYSLMITVIRSAISEMKKKGYNDNYNQLIKSLKEYSKGIVDIKKLRVWIMAFAHNAFHLDERCTDLIDVIFNLNWTEHDNNLALAYIMFLSNLISSNPSLYQNRVLQMLVQKFAFRRIPNNLEKINGRVHTAVKSIIKITPNSVDLLYKLIVEEFPHKAEPLYVHITYLKNLLQLLEYTNKLQSDVLQLIFSQLIQIDTEIQGKFNDIKDLEDSIPQYNISLYGDGNNSDSLNSMVYQKLSTIQTNLLSSSQSHQNNDVNYNDFNMLTGYDDESDGDNMDNTSQMVTILDIKDLLEKLDCMMKLLFDYLSWCYKNTTKKGQEEIYRVLMNVFEKRILHTCKSRYVQFIIFWYVSLDYSFSRRYLTLILRKTFGEQESEIIRFSATQYLASFAARAKFLKKQELRQIFHIVGSWIERYICKYKVSVADKQAKQNKHFYSVLTDIMYIFCYRWSDLANKNGWCKETDWIKTILNSNFKPLEMCAQSIVEVFIYITNKVNFLQCNANYRIRHDEEEESLWEMSKFFPFDPFGLKTSQHYLNDIYIHWEGFSE
nr:4565_t:CDS:2 [Entrophospora candida]